MEFYDGYTYIVTATIASELALRLMEVYNHPNIDSAEYGFHVVVKDYQGNILRTMLFTSKRDILGIVKGIELAYLPDLKEEAE